MRRRDFIKVVGGAAAAWPLAARAQQPERMRRIGSLTSLDETDAQAQVWYAAFRTRLQELGWVIGRNLQIDYRWGAGDIDRIRTYAAELVAMKPDALLASTTPVVAALLRETHTIPSYFRTCPIRSAAASRKVCHIQEAMLPDGLISPRPWVASGWSCSRRLRRASDGSGSYLIRLRLPT